MSADLVLTRLAGQLAPQAGGAISLAVAPGIEVAGVGRVSLDRVTLADQNQTRVSFGYGGVRVAVHPWARWPGLSLSLLAGAGNLDAEDATTGGVLDSENGAIVEPGISFTRALVGRLGISASAWWRHAFEFESVVGLDSGDLAGPALGIGLSFGPM